MGSAVAGLGLFASSNAWALTCPGQPSDLSGTDFALDIVESPINITGAARHATTVNGSVPETTLRCGERDMVTLRVRNRLRVPTSIHWHGIVLPHTMDGVPGLSFDGIAPSETFTYRFPLRQSGRYWYHSHSRFHEQTGLYGALIVDPAGAPRYPSDCDSVVILND